MVDPWTTPTMFWCWHNLFKPLVGGAPISARWVCTRRCPLFQLLELMRELMTVGQGDPAGDPTAMVIFSSGANR